MKSGSLSRVAFDLNLSMMLVDDPVGNGETEAHAAFLGRKEGIKEFLQVFGRDPNPGILDREFHPAVILQDPCAEIEPASLSAWPGRH